MLQALYTYLYTGSILFLCYVFFYVLRVKVRGEGVDQYQVEMENFIKQMVRTAGIEVQNIEGRGQHSGYWLLQLYRIQIF